MTMIVSLKRLERSIQILLTLDIINVHFLKLEVKTESRKNKMNVVTCYHLINKYMSRYSCPKIKLYPKCSRL